MIENNKKGLLVVIHQSHETGKWYITPNAWRTLDETGEAYNTKEDAVSHCEKLGYKYY
jgi:hypothetical protein